VPYPGTVPFPGQLLSVFRVSIIASVDEGGGSGVVHISVGVSGSCRYVSRISSSGREVVGIVGIVRDYVLAIRAVSLPILLSIVGIGRITCVDEGGSSGMVYISVGMGRNSRYVSRETISGIVIIWVVGTVSFPGQLLSVLKISIITSVDKGGGSGMVHISVGMGGSCRYVSRISRSGRVGVVGIVRDYVILAIRTVSLPVLLSIVGISIIASVDEGGSNGVVHISVAMGRNCGYVGRVSISGRVGVGIGMSCVAGVVRVDGCIAMRCGIMMSASDHGRTCGPTHMNLVMISTPSISAISVVSISVTIVAISIAVVAVTVVGCISVISSIAPICTTVTSVASVSSVSSIAAITAITPAVAIIAVSVSVVGSLDCR